jgi:hypothetical protein
MTNEAVAEDENFEARAAYPSGGLGYELTREIPHEPQYSTKSRGAPLSTLTW